MTDHTSGIEHLRRELAHAQELHDIRYGPQPRTTARPSTDPPSEAERLEAQGLHFTARALRLEEKATDHRIRARQVKVEVDRRDRIYAKLRDRYGPAEAERLVQEM